MDISTSNTLNRGQRWTLLHSLNLKAACQKATLKMAFLQDDPPLPPLDTLFPYLQQDPTSLPSRLDPFTVTTSAGFMPSNLPLVDLPPPFGIVLELLNEMPVAKEDGAPGLLASFDLGPAIDENNALPDLTQDVQRLLVERTAMPMGLITALFRDYSFLASAYLLEPCWKTWSRARSAGYGLGRKLLPHCIAGPLLKCAEILDIPPFMSYAASYALYNYRLVDRRVGTSDYDNLRLIRAFEHGLDPKSSEAGFILTHIHMVRETGPLVSGAVSLLQTIESAPAERSAITSAFHQMLTAMQKIEAAMESMWSHSRPQDYISYRTFIFGITNQSMFPNGVVYEGCNDNKPLYFRGESGANDSIIPLLDHLCEIPMPQNPLTEILMDFRNYRPKPHRTFLAYVMSKAAEVGVRDFCVKEGGEVAMLYLKLLDHIRSFRWRHWLFAREYIIKRTKHATATGGSPIVTWLPNQLAAVTDAMQQVYAESGLEADVAGVCAVGMKADGTKEYRFVEELMENVSVQRLKLAKEVRKYCEERGVPT